MTLSYLKHRRTWTWRRLRAAVGGSLGLHFGCHLYGAASQVGGISGMALGPTPPMTSVWSWIALPPPHRWNLTFLVSRTGSHLHLTAVLERHVNHHHVQVLKTGSTRQDQFWTLQAKCNSDVVPLFTSYSQCQRAVNKS